MGAAMRRWDLRETVWGVALAVSAILIGEALFFGFDPQRIYLDSPTMGDSAHWYAATKIMLEEGWLCHSARLSWPWGLDIAGFPLGGMLDFLLLRLVGCFTDNIFIIVAYALLGSVVVGSLAAYGMMRALGCTRFFAFLFALLFAFSPNLYYRNIHHFHSLGYMAPIGAGLAAIIFCGRKAVLRHRRLLFALAFAVGLTYAYTVAFTLFLMLIALVRQIVVPDTAFRKLGGILLLCTLGGFILASLPTLYVYHNDPQLKEKLMSFKAPSEADRFGLYLRNLLRPAPVEKPFYRDVEKIYEDAKFNTDGSEQRFARLGTLGSLGFLLLLLNMLGLVRIRAIDEDAERKRVFFALSSLNMAAVLLAIPGGFGSMINMFSAQIRCYNRISPFIAFFALTAWGVLLTAFYKSRSRWRSAPGRTILGIAGVAVLCFGIGVDQKAIPGHLFVRNVAHIQSARSMLEEFAPVFPKDPKVLVLPVLTYPIRSFTSGDIPGSADVAPYLADDGSYSWSVMPLAPEAERRLLELVKLRGREFFRAAHTLGYNTILYDTRANAAQYIELIKSLEDTGLESHVSKDGRYMIFTVAQEGGRQAD